MACSKLFSGDLPEISSYIIQNLRNNVNTLYSLTLVNRFWCRLAIPLLWEDPFSVKYRENLPFHFIDIYFLFLSDNDKSEMKTQFYNKFSKFDSNLHKPLFNYPSLIKTINFCRIELHVENWLSTSSVQQSSNKKSCLQLINLQIERFKEVNEEEMEVCTALLRLFMENNASLNNLYIINNYYSLKQIYDMILNHPKFISEIEIFSFDYFRCYWPIVNLDSIQTFLSSLPNYIKHINLSTILSTNLSINNINNLEFENDFAKIIQSQIHLSSVKFSSFSTILLDSLKHLSNTLTSISFYSSNFSNTMRFDALSYLTQLESLQFNYCSGINSKVIQPLLSISTPLRIKTFVFFSNRFENLIEVSTPIQLLIQKIGSYIENLVLGIHEDELRGKSFDVIINVCEKIKFLHLDHIDFENCSQLSRMVLNFNNYLKYLTLKIKYDMFHNYDCSLKISSMILNELSKSLPLSLHYLDLSLVTDDLQIAFENCKQVELKKLLIRDCGENNMVATLEIIRDFVKEKRLEFLAYYIVYDYFVDEKNEEYHKKLEKLVEETQSFTKMVEYDDLVVKISIDGNLIIN